MAPNSVEVPLEQEEINLLPSTGWPKDEIICSRIRSIGDIPVPPFPAIALPPLLAVALVDEGSVVPVPLLGTHPVVSRQDPLTRVIRLLTPECPPLRRTTSVLSLLRCPSNLVLLSSFFRRGRLQKLFKAAPKARQVLVDEWTVLVLRSLVPAGRRLDRTRLKLPLRCAVAELTFGTHLLRAPTVSSPLPRPPVRLLPEHVPCPLVLILAPLVLGTLTPNFPSFPLFLDVDGPKTSYSIRL